MHEAVGGSPDRCPCGRRLSSPEGSSSSRYGEMRCACGRAVAYELTGAAWKRRAILTPEGSVPVRGFSRELRLQEDAERFWFLHPIGGKPLPVHVVFCPSLAIAEVKAADMKVLRLERAATASEACVVWIERREKARSSLRPSASNRIGPLDMSRTYNI